MTTENHVQGLKPGLASIHACEINGQDRFQGPLAAHRNHTVSITTLFNFFSANTFLFFLIIINFLAFA